MATNEWQPISTAPKNGTPVLLFSPDAGNQVPSLAFWLECDAESSGWYDFWSDRGSEIDAEPTHWMPLPAPPGDA